MSIYVQVKIVSYIVKFKQQILNLDQNKMKRILNISHKIEERKIKFAIKGF